MHYIMIYIAAFVRKMLTEESGTSSKRINGTLCILSVVLSTFLSIVFKWNILPSHEFLLSTIFWGGTGLLGLTSIEKYLKPRNEKSVHKETE